MFDFFSNLISLSLLPVGFAMDELISMLANHIICIMAVMLTISFEYMLFKDILNDPDRVTLAMATGYAKKLSHNFFTKKPASKKIRTKKSGVSAEPNFNFLSLEQMNACNMQGLTTASCVQGMDKQ